MYRACLVHLHPCYVVRTTVPGYHMGHSLLLRPRQFCSACVNADIWRSHLLHGKFPGPLQCPRDTLLETHPMDALEMLTMCSLVTTPWMAGRPFSPPFSAGAVTPSPSWKSKPWLFQNAVFLGPVFSLPRLEIGEEAAWGGGKRGDQEPSPDLLNWDTPQACGTERETPLGAQCLQG